jgi:hypothetical protein
LLANARPELIGDLRTPVDHLEVGFSSFDGARQGFMVDTSTTHQPITDPR